MRRGIVRKLFISMLSIFLIVMGVQIVFQEFFIDDAYKHTKIVSINKELDQMNYDLINNNSINELYFKDEDVVFSYFDKNGVIYNDDFLGEMNYIVINNKKIIFNDFFDEQGDIIEEVDMKLNDTVEVTYVEIPNSEYFLGIKLKNNNDEYLSDYSENIYENSYLIKNEKQVLKGAINSLNSRKFDTKKYLSAKLLIEIFNIVEDESLEFVNEKDNELYDMQVDYSFEDNDTGNNYEVFIRKLNNSDKYSIVLFEIKELGAAVNSISIYYYYIFALQILLIIIISFIYSRKFSKPLLELNKSAKEIADKNFYVKTDIRTNDELEDLSNNINSIADNLSNSLKTLEERNDDLKKYASKKEKDEEKMRNLLMDLSHEFRTPLGVISGFVELLEDDLGDKPKDYYYNVISDEIQNLNGLVENTLELMHLEDEVELKIEKIDLCQLIESVIDNFSLSAQTKNINLKLYGIKLYTYADYNKIKRVFNNLISNAIKYSIDDSDVNIEIVDVMNYTEINVINSPIESIDVNMNTDVLFDRFYRKESSRNRDIGGYGLGLSIVSKILDKHKYFYEIKIYENQFVFKIKIPKNI